MKKKITAYLILIVLILVFVVSSSSYLMKKITDLRWKSSSIIWRSDGFRFGGLFYMSFLSKYKIDNNWYPQKAKKDSSIIDLYIIGDSYLDRCTDKKNFSKVDSLIFVDWRYGPREIELRKNKKNILIIETTERYLRERFHNSTDFKFQFVAITNRNSSASSENKLIQYADQFFFNKNISQNLEFNLFDYPLFTEIKSIKADFNQSVFNRHASGISISNDKSILFLKSTTDTSLTTSSFNSVTNEEIAQMASVANAVFAHYKNFGFEKIIFTVIPNPVSISGYKNYSYNNLIPRFENQNLNVTLVDLYKDFSKQPVLNNYFAGDSHWNTNGLQVWLDKINTELLK